MKTTTFTKIIKLLLPIALVLTASTAHAEDTTELQGDGYCSDLKERMIEWSAQSAASNWYWQSYWQKHRYRSSRPSSAPSQEPVAEGAAAADSSSGGPNNYTTTNNQEAGVDEADMVKTDGKYIYTAVNGEVLIIKSWPVKDSKVIARLNLGEGAQPRQLFLNGNKLVVLSNIYEQLPQPETQKSRRVNPYNYYNHYQSYFQGTRISVVDIEDRTQPQILRHTDVEGYMNQARMIGYDVYVVSNSWMQVHPKINQAAFDFVAKQKPANFANNHKKQIEQQKRMMKRIRRHLTAKFRKADLTDGLPRTRRSGFKGSKMGKFKPMYACNDIKVPKQASQLGMLNVVHMDIRNTSKVNGVGIAASGWQVYASTSALYVGMADYGWNYYWGWNSDQQTQGNRTIIHKIKLRGSDENAPEYAGSGEVRGHLLNQFSMSEYRGDLRVATTDQGWWNNQANAELNANNIFVLRPTGNKLKQIGAIQDIAPGERIYSARMMGDKGYVVTFRQTDPLYTLDLSNPHRPKVVGELKIPGFSSYIHPLGQDRLLTIGQDADENGRVKGVHLQIFDVSNPAKPKRSFHKKVAISGYSWSLAQWDHHAFTFDRVTGTLAFPLSMYGNNYSENFTGLMLFHVDAEDGFVALGRVSHEDLVSEYFADLCESDTTNSPYRYQCTYRNNGYNWWQAQMSRSIIMDDYVFAFSHYGMSVNSIYRPKKNHANVIFLKS